MNIAKVKVLKNDKKKKILWLFGCILCLYFFVLVMSPVARYYSLAYIGNSEAMYYLADEYYKNPGELLQSNGRLGDYWIRKSAGKGNLDAIKLVEAGWSVLNPKEVIYWLEKGVDFGHPWCAEQLARGYWLGLYGLKIDPVKEAEYRAIGKRLRAEGKGSRWDQ